MPRRAKVTPSDQPLERRDRDRVAVTLAETRSRVIADQPRVLLRPEGRTRRTAPPERVGVAEQEEEHGQRDDEGEEEARRPLQQPPGLARRGTRASLPTLAVILAMASSSGGRNGARSRAHAQAPWSQAPAPPWFWSWASR